MFIKSTSFIHSSQPTFELIKQDKLKAVISFIALAILFASTVYWISSYFWKDREVKKDIPEIEDQDLTQILTQADLRKPDLEMQSVISSEKKNAGQDSKGVSPFSKKKGGPLENKNNAEQPSIKTTANLQEANLKLQKIIKNAAQPVTQDPIHNLIELQTHVHHIFENVYLGNLRAYYSVDPKFVAGYSMVDSEEIMVDSFRLYDEDLSLNQAKKLYQNYQAKAKDGCVNLNIKHVISVTQFKAKDTVSVNDWSRFQPDLEGLEINRMQIKVDDDEFAWDTITPHFEEIFDKIDHARLNHEPLLIHCVEGKSRSVTVLIAYLINRCDVSFEEALTFVQNIRPQAEPKPSLANALKSYHA